MQFYNHHQKEGEVEEKEKEEEEKQEDEEEKEEKVENKRKKDITSICYHEEVLLSRTTYNWLASTIKI